MIIALTSQTLPLATVDDYAENILSQQISRIDGVGQVIVGGQQKPAVRIQIDPRKVAALGLQLDDIRASIASQTVNAPKGIINGTLKNYNVYANDQILNATPWKNLLVGYHNGAAVRSATSGSVVQGVENDQAGAWMYPGTANTGQNLKARPGGAADRLQGSPAPTSSRPSTASTRRCRGSRPTSRRRSTSASWPTAPRPSAPRCATSRSPC